MQELKDFLKNFLSKFDLMQFMVALTIIVLMLAVAYTVMYREVPQENRELFNHLIGIVEGSFVGGLVGYYFTRSKDKPTQ